MRAVREHDVLSFSGDSHRSSLEQQRFPIAPALTAVSKTASAISAAASAFLLAAWFPIAAQAQADNTPPSIPTGLAGTAVSPTQINLSWNPSTDNVAVAGYYVYVNDQWQTPLGPTTATSFQHTGRSPNTTYNYRVSSFDTSSNDSAWTAPPVSVTTPAAQARDPLKWPFASTSIWNMPIGSNAVYAPANIPAIFDEPDTPVDEMEWAPMPSVDWDIIVLTPTAPLTNIVRNNVGWNAGDRCATDNPGDLLFRLPMPSNFIVPDPYEPPQTPPATPNGSAAFLKPDGRTLIQTQPFTRCVAGGPGTTWTDRSLFPPVDLYGDGIKGSHGGSGLSAIGGSLRIGELQRGSPERPRHALKLNVYSALILYDCSSRDPQSTENCFRWPAQWADNYAPDDVPYGYGRRRAGNSREMKMGALLAIPASVNLSTMGLETEPGKQLAWTLQNYGAYINDTQEEQAFTFDAESGPGPDGLFTSFKAQFEFDYGFPLEQRWRGTSRNTSLWSSDMQKLMTALHVVTNNGPNSIGGGGTPRQPLAPPLALTRFDEDWKLGPPGATVSTSPNSSWVQRGADFAAFNNGTATSSNANGATVTFTFTGTSVSWIGYRGPQAGIARVILDGTVVADSLDMFIPIPSEAPQKAVFTLPGLTNQSHTLIIEVTGSKNPASLGVSIVVDAFDVTP